MNVSVIIPAYNVETFIEKAIDSALQQPQVAEVVVINDGSSDSTQVIIESITDPRIKILHHPDRVNKGRSASRNLGLQHAQSDYIAFLDADDFYLPNRFVNDEHLFEKYKDISGVYNAVGFTYAHPEIASQHNLPDKTTVSKNITPERLGIELVRGQYGHIHLNGLTVKREDATAILFPEHLPVTEDTVWIWKLAFNNKLVAGKLKESVAMRCVHETNIFNNTTVYNKYEKAFFKEMLDWSMDEKKELHIVEMFIERLWITANNSGKGLSNLFNLWTETFLMQPRLLFSHLVLKYFPFIYKWKSIRKKITEIWN